MRETLFPGVEIELESKEMSVRRRLRGDVYDVTFPRVGRQPGPGYAERSRVFVFENRPLRTLEAIDCVMGQSRSPPFGLALPEGLGTCYPGRRNWFVRFCLTS